MLIDVSMPIKNGAVYRQGAPPVEIAARKFFHESEGAYETVILSMPVHTATHIDLVHPGNQLALERMCGPGKLLDATQIKDHRITLADVAAQADLRPGDFVFIRTGWSRWADTDEYYRHPEVAGEVIQWLISRQINAVGIDAPGLGRGKTHGQYDRLLVAHGIFIIENLAHLEAIPTPTFRVYGLPLSLAQVDAIPARVIVETAPPPAPLAENVPALG